MAAGSALRQAGTLEPLTLQYDGQWQPQTITLPEQAARRLTLVNHSNDWHLMALGSETSLRDQALMHRLMPDLRKDFPNTRLLEAGGQATLDWRFDEPGHFAMRCMRPDHQDREAPLLITVKGPAGARR
ncbi:blue (type 1) copper domain protein [Alcanivorax hongdengensis A-11-3]|uniref:Blue (Type 1) copper domain protein n=1 Tax=Alcanivorax hongdengensis A-11-3 TaxID=1177179 RepID=L0WCB0_9GAMM|nr:blue (type 1) copper domain protein [Alcanivorax hongdengensis]EKF74388.1 blue (type 1) copper domain protein [Alcanivorax hongdengensis A-11-3]